MGMTVATGQNGARNGTRATTRQSYGAFTLKMGAAGWQLWHTERGYLLDMSRQQARAFLRRRYDADCLLYGELVAHREVA